MRKHEIIIRLHVPAWLKRRHLFLIGAIVVCFGIASYAAPLNLHVFQRDERLSSATMNGNFGALQDAVNALQTQVAAKQVLILPNGKTYSVGATRFCGGTTTSYNGNLGGYAGAKALCQTACGNSASAHMCTSDEMIRSVSAGIIPSADGWYASGSSAKDPSGPTSDDCGGWTDGSNTLTGAVWNVTGRPAGGQPYTFFCGNMSPALPIDCCD